MLKRLLLLAGAVLVLALWGAICRAAVVPFHPSSPFPAAMLFLVTLAFAAYRIRTLPTSWRPTLADQGAASLLDSAIWPQLAPRWHAADLAVYIMLAIFAFHALLFIPSIGVGMLAATFSSEAETNAVLD